MTKILPPLSPRRRGKALMVRSLRKELFFAASLSFSDKLKFLMTTWVLSGGEGSPGARSTPSLARKVFVNGSQLVRVTWRPYKSTFTPGVCLSFHKVLHQLIKYLQKYMKINNYVREYHSNAYSFVFFRRSKKIFREINIHCTWRQTIIEMRPVPIVVIRPTASAVGVPPNDASGHTLSFHQDTLTRKSWEIYLEGGWGP